MASRRGCSGLSCTRVRGFTCWCVAAEVSTRTRDCINDACADCARVRLDVNGLDRVGESNVLERDVADTVHQGVGWDAPDRHTNSPGHLAVANHNVLTARAQRVASVEWLDGDGIVEVLCSCQRYAISTTELMGDST